MLLSTKHRIIGVPSEGKLQTLFPEAKHLHYEGKDLILLDHDIVTTHLLRSMGMDAPAPVLSHYDWGGIGTPFEVQKKTVAMLTQTARGYVLNGMGTGKTKAA